MSRNRIPILIAAGALVAGLGAGAGVGGYAALGGGKTTTVVQEAPATGSPAAATKSTSVGDVYRNARDGVVEVTTTSTASGAESPFPFGGGGSRETRSQGSGFVYDADGHVVTNYHVVRGAKSVSVTFADGSKYGASVVGSDPSTDIAVLEVDVPSSKLHPVSLGDSSALSVGDGVVAIGSPFGLEETVTSGIVSALDRSISSTNAYTIPGVIQTDAAINHGNSGGPLLNMSGQVIGVTTQIESESGGNDGVGFAVPSNTIRAVVSDIVGGKKVEHAFLGVSIGDATSRAGAEVGSVRKGSPAAKAGLKAGDVITGFDGGSISSADDLTLAVSSKSPGDQVRITYIRDEATKSATVTLGNRSS